MQGHYILLVGYLSSCRQFVYRNPTVRDRLCQIPAPALEAGDCRDEAALEPYRDPTTERASTTSA